MNKKQIAITLGIMCFILTVAICVQLKTVENTTSTVSQSLKENGLRDEVLKWKERYDNAYEELTKSNKDLEEIRKSATQNDTKSQAKQEEIKKNNMLLGLQEVKGEGLLIKLADRLHNMRTLSYIPRNRQIANAKETMDLYAPLANRLGLYSLKWELEDLSFKYLHPEEYHELVEGINKKREK